MTKTQAQAARLIVKLVYETVAEAGEAGAPTGVVFAALSAHGCSKSQWDALERSMLDVGILTRSGDVLHAVPAKAREIGLAS